MSESAEKAGPAGLTLPWRIAYLATFLFVILAYFRPVPVQNEGLYLLAAYRWWRPEFLATDWTYGVPWREYALFNTLAGLLTLGLPLAWVAWGGRLSCWALALAGLFRLGRRFELSPALTAAAIVPWVLAGQTPIVADWVFGAFEAKVPAYAAVFFALDDLVGGRDRRGALLLGLAFSLHPSVGLPTALGVGVALLLTRAPLARIARVVGWATLSALPGIVTATIVSLGEEPATPDDWRFVALARLPQHLDPSTFGRRGFAELAVLLAGSFVLARLLPPRRDVRFLLAFLIGTGLPFLVGAIAFLAGHFTLLKVQPFRVLPLFAALFGSFSAMRAISLLRGTGRPRAAGATVLLCLVALGSSALRYRHEWGLTPRLWRGTDDLEGAFRWTADHTPADALLLAPPTRRNSFYFSRRPQVVNWWAIRYDRLGEWRRRLNELVGPLDTGFRPPDVRVLESRFYALDSTEIARLAVRYRAAYLLSAGRYGFPAVHREGHVTVYRLR